MEKITSLSSRTYRHLMHDSLRRNSVYLLLSSGISALLAFVFWSIAAHIYPPSEVGVITALIAISAFIVEFSQIGLVNGLIRHLATFRDKKTILNTVFMIVGCLAILSSVIFIIVLHYILPKASFITQNLGTILIFIAYVMANAYGSILDGLFVALRVTELSLARNMSVGLVKILVALIIGEGLIGLFSSITIATILGVLFGFFFLWHRLKLRPTRKLTKEVFSISQFSIVNYLSSGSATLAIAIIPILIIHKIGSSAAAFYYIAYSITALLSYIPRSVSQSFFAESSLNEDALKAHLRKSAKFIGLLMVPSAAFIMLAGKYILLLFGKEYSEAALTCLRLLTLTSVLSPINWLGDNILNVQKRMKLYSFTNIFSASTTVIFMYPLLKYGLTGVGLGWLLSEIATVLIYLYIFRTNLFQRRVSS